MLAALAAVLAYYSVTFSVAQVVVKTDPAIAHQLAPYDGRITATYAASLAGDDATRADRQRADTIARQALRQDPTAVTALSTLGIDADFSGDKFAARRMFTAAYALSRRNLATQLWMIENAVAHGDISQTLHQYDITLRVFPTMGEILYPVLASASTDPAIRSKLVQTLATKPVWGENFINFIAGSSSDPRTTAALFLGLRRAGVTVPETAQAGVISALIGAEQFDATWSYYAAVRPGVDRRRSRDPHFSAKTVAPSQLDWIPLNDGGLTTNIQGGIFDFSAPASVGGPLLQQLQLLPPGTYRLTGHSIGLDMPAGAHPYWTLGCRGGRELGRIEMPNSAVAEGVFTGTFSVSADCPVQMLVLNARPSDAVSGLSGQIDRAELVPIAR